MNTSPRQKFSLKEAAERLDITVDAARQRFKRGLLEGEKDEDGRIYVWMDVNPLSKVDSTQALLEAKDEVIDTLRQELEDWKEEARRKDHLLANLMQRIPELEPAREKPSEPLTADSRGSEEQSKGAAVPQDAAEDEIRKSWWRRLFGG